MWFRRKAAKGGGLPTKLSVPPAGSNVNDIDAPKAVPYLSLYRYADKWDILCIIIGTLGAIGNGIAMPLFSIIFGNVINSIGLNLGDPAAVESAVQDNVYNFLYLGAGSFCAAFIQVFFWTIACVRQVNTLRKMYFKKALHQDMSYYDTTATSGRLLQGLNEDALVIQSAIGDKMAMFIFSISTAISGFVIAFTKGVSMTLIIMALLPVIAGTGYLISTIVTRMTMAVNKAFSHANALAQQALSNIRTVYSFNAQEKTLQEFDTSLQDPLKVGIKQSVWGGLTVGITQCTAYCAYALAMWWGAKQVADGSENGGEVLNVLFAALIGGFALGQAVPNMQAFIQGKAAAGRVYAIMQRKSEISVEDSSNDNSEGKQLEQVQGNVHYDNISFTYPTAPDKPVLTSFTLSIPAGHIMSLVGESGSGKSTVIGLLERFYDPTQGTITLDGVDIRQLNLKWLRGQIGLVGQEPVLFATSILENIKFSEPDATMEEVVFAAKLANAERFVSKLPLGYDTHVGEKGVQLSGGQKQRIAIARAILRNPRILLLDEATSALDAESERVVQDALSRVQKGRTVLVVAHRLSTVVGSDCIAVVKKGAVVEQGTHRELLRKEGAYAALVHMQQEKNNGSGVLMAAVPVDVVEEVDIGGYGKEYTSSADDTDGGIGGTSSGNNTTDDEIQVRIVPFFGTTTTTPTAAPVTNATTSTTITRLTPASTPTKKSTTTTPAKPVNVNSNVKKVSLRRIAQLNKQEAPYLLGGLVGSAVLGMTMPIFSIAFSSLINTFYFTSASEIRDGAQQWVLVFVGVGFAALLFSVLQSYCFGKMGQKLSFRIRLLMMTSLLKQEVAWYDEPENNSGVLVNKLATDALAVKGQYGDSLGLLTQNLVTVIAAYVIAGINCWKMMLVMTAFVPVLFAAVWIQTKLILRYTHQENDRYAGANQIASEAFSSIKTVVAFGMESQIQALYVKELETPTSQSRKRGLATGFGFGFATFTLFAIYAISFWYGALLISRNEASFDDVLKAFFAIFLAAFSFSSAQLHFPDVAKGKAASQRAFSIIDRKPLIDSSSQEGLKPSACQGALELRDVGFTYPARPNVAVLTNFCLNVPASTSLAMVGESGSGKSTVISLVERFYDTTHGSVLLDGVDIRELNLRWMRQQISLVGQEPVLFDMTVADNIRFGKEDASMEVVMEVAKRTNAFDFIEHLPEGFNTKLGAGGITLSGGQKQRVAIARALIKQPRILLLDEATSALDAESERVVQDALDLLMVGRTTLIVAHRLSTVRHAGSIAVVHQGGVIEQGTHEELVKKVGGSYARLVQHQLLRK